MRRAARVLLGALSSLGKEMGTVAYWTDKKTNSDGALVYCTDTDAYVADDGTTYPAGQAIVTPAIIGKEQIAWFIEMMNLGYVEDLAQFKQDQVVVRNASDRSRVDSLIPAHLVSGLRVLAGQLRFLL